MIEVTIKDGTKVTYDKPFVLEDTHLAKFRCVRNGDAEGMWFWIHPDDKADYDADVNDSKVRLGVAANHGLNGLPWGCYFPYIMMGDIRPECDMDKLIDLESTPVKCEEAFKKDEEF